MAAANPPVVYAIDPNSGSALGGTSVTLHGIGFSGATSVMFGGTSVSGFSVGDDNHISVRSAPGTAGATVHVTVTTSAGSSVPATQDQFSYVAAAAPAVYALSPNSGTTAGGTPLTIFGTGFMGATSISFGGTTIPCSASVAPTLPSPASGGGTMPMTSAPDPATIFQGSEMAAYRSALRERAFTAPTLPTPASRGAKMTAPTLPSSASVGGKIATGFQPRIQSSLGGGACASGLSDGFLSVLTPLGSTGAVDVKVTTGAGTSLVNLADRFTFAPPTAPAVYAVDPQQGPAGGGTAVTIHGSGFSGASEVRFGNGLSSFFVGDDSQIFATSPPAYLLYTVDVVVITPAGRTAITPADQFNYTTASSPPVVSAIDPHTGPAAGGTEITIYGSGLSNPQSVSFGTVVLSCFVSWGPGKCVPGLTGVSYDNALFVTAPPGSVGTVDIKVTTALGTSAITRADTFTYVPSSPPVVNAIHPASGPATGGTKLQILGSGFTGVTSITFGGTVATFDASDIFADDNRMSATSPAGPANSTVDVQITTPAGTSAITAADRFTFTVPLAPVIKAVDPNHGPGGTPVTIYGNGFSGATAVNFGSTPGRNVSVGSDNSITVGAPAGTPGSVDITVTTPVGTSAKVAGDQFMVEAPAPPVITYFGATVGPTAGGTLVYITGSGFLDANGVSFGSTAGTSLSILSDRLISVGSPAGTGQVHLTVSAPGGSVTSNGLFTYSTAPPPSNPPPEVDAVGPNQGTSYGGSSVTVFGRGFTGGGNVQFGSEYASFTFGFGDNTIFVFSNPAGIAGQTVDVRVTTANGTSAVNLGDRFTYLTPQRPVVLSVQPDHTLAVGRTNLQIHGHWLSAATDVRLGNVRADEWFAFDDEMSVFGPPGTPGTVDVTVTTAAGVSAIVPGDQLTYVAEGPPVVSAVSPRAGPSEGGTTAYISGTGLFSVSAVRFGAAAVPNLRVVAIDDGLIRVTSPPGTASSVPVDVTVTTPVGTSPISAADQFTYGPSPPAAVTVVSPNSGPANGGATVNITGTGLADAVAVNFGTTSAFSFVVFSDGLIQAISPPGTASTTVDVTVTTRAGTTAATTADRFSFTPASPPLVVATVGPSSGPSVGGTVVYIMGSGLGGANAVNFGPFRSSSFVALSDSLIRAVSPTGAVGSVDVSVTTPAGTSPRSAGDVFTYQPTAPPTVTAVTPSSGAAGSPTFITGTGLFGATSIHFGSTAAVNPIIISDTLVRVLAPPAPAGTVDVTVSTLAGSSAPIAADRFTYTAPIAPSVTVVGPTTGPQGTVAFITGRGLGAVTSVMFGAMSADFLIDSDTLIEAPAPNGSGSVDITVTSAAGTSPTSVADLYTFTAEANPVFTAVSRNQYTLQNSDGVAWQDIDATNLVLKIAPTTPSLAVITGNADLWTANAGYNQDLGLDVDGTIVGWKESGGYAGTFSPNAAFAQGLAVMLAGPTYTVKLKWKTNRPAPGTTIYAGAGSSAGFSPTRLTVELLPLRGYNLRQAASSLQRWLPNSDGATWMDMDPAGLALSYTPQVDGTALVSGNADLWTANAGYNQDIGIAVNGGTAAGATYPTVAGQPEAWKESGGFAGTFSPNAAFVQTAIRMTANTTYSLKLQWKANKPASGATIFAGAGPIVGAYSPTRLVLQFIPAGTGLSDRHSENQYTFPNSNGTDWQAMDTTNLSLSITPAKRCLAIVSVNADLWTANAGFNQDVGIAVSGGAAPGFTYPTVVGQPEAWKESGGFAGTFSPNAAYVQGVIPVASGTAYTFGVVWKANKDASGATLFAAAGPIGTRYSPTRLTVQLISCS